jgi:predicted DsbA family dithiol-disulfide isomerase
MEIDIYSDPVCPWCFIGKRRLERALSLRPGQNPTVRWRTFQLNPDMPQEGIERDRYLTLKFGGAERARQLYDNIRKVGSTVGIDFAFEKIARTPNTIQAHRLIRYASETPHSDAVIERLFVRYFVEGGAIDNEDALIQIAIECGLPKGDVTTYLAGDENLTEVHQEDSAARRLGIQGVPCFIINNQYALSGAQEPEAFFPIFEIASQEMTTAAR